MTSRRTFAKAAAATLLGGCQSSRREARATASERGRDPVATVVQLVPATAATDGVGARLMRVFPAGGLRHLDPFVLLDDFDVAKPAGFPEHPHRGFEAFTYMLEGSFEHKDSMGNESVVSAGGIQRFTSGRGARHSEMPGPGPRNRGLQLWVNLPRRLKGIAPEYEGRQGEALPVRALAGTRQRIIVGRGSPVELRTEVDYRDVTLGRGQSFRHEVEPAFTTLVYVLEGAIDIAGQSVPRQHLARLSGGRLLAKAEAPARFAYLSGRPHDEPILQRGPFVD